MTPATSAFRRSLMAEAKIPGRGSLFFAMGLVGVLGALIIALLVWQNHVARQRFLADARQLAYHHSRVLAERAARVSEAADLAVWQVAEAIRAHGGIPADALEAPKLLRGVQPLVPALSSVVVHDATGRRVAAIGVLPTVEDVSGLDFFREHRAGQLGYTVTVHSDPGRVRVSRRLEGPGGDFAGVVSAVIDPAAFDLGLELDVTHALDGAALVLRTGQVLAEWPRTFARRPPEGADIATRPAFAGLPREALTAAGAETVELTGTIVAVAPVGHAPFLAAASIAKERALAAWQAEWRLTFAAVVVLIAAIGLIGIRLGHRHERRRGAVQRTLSVLARAVEDSPAMAVITDPDGIIEYANRTFEEVTGYGRDEVVGATPAALAAGHAEPGALDDLWSAVRAGRGWSGDLQVRKKTGEAFRLGLTVSPILDARGRVANFAAVGRDITERVENERYRRQSEKARALGTLVDGIAHEFNNMLTPVLTMTSLVMETMAPDSRERQMLEVSARSARRAHDLVRRLRIFARGDPGRWQVHDAADLVRDAATAATAKVPAEIEIRTEIEDGIGRVKADSAQIEAAVANLVANAVDAIGPKAGTVTVSLRRARAEGAGRRPPPGLAPGPHAVIAVTDSGEGMDAEVIERIFDPFFSTRDVGQGTGLGLSIVQGVVATHGGTIQVDSQPGAGTTFLIFLPLLEAAQEGAESETTTPDWPQRARR